MNGKGAHRLLSHQCGCGENLKWILDKQVEILNRQTVVPAGLLILKFNVSLLGQKEYMHMCCYGDHKPAASEVAPDGSSCIIA